MHNIRTQSIQSRGEENSLTECFTEWNMNFIFGWPVFKSVLSLFDSLHKTLLQKILIWEGKKKCFILIWKLQEKLQKTVEHMEMMYNHPGRHQTALTEECYTVMQFTPKVLLFPEHAEHSKKTNIPCVHFRFKRIVKYRLWWVSEEGQKWTAFMQLMVWQ